MYLKTFFLSILKNDAILLIMNEKQIKLMSFSDTIKDHLYLSNSEINRLEATYIKDISLLHQKNYDF